MAVLKTTSPAPSETAPKLFPATTVPSSNASLASLMDDLPADDGERYLAAQFPAVKRRVARLGAPPGCVILPHRLVEDDHVGGRAARQRATGEPEDARAGDEFFDQLRQRQELLVDETQHQRPR